MMTSRATIESWFDRGVAEGAIFMIVASDTFSHEDYPVFASGDDDVLAKHAQYDDKEMQRVMEVYDLRASKSEQMAERRCMRLPAVSE